jgi:hypothetical protein
MNDSRAGAWDSPRALAPPERWIRPKFVFFRRNSKELSTGEGEGEGQERACTRVLRQTAGGLASLVIFRIICS